MNWFYEKKRTLSQKNGILTIIRRFGVYSIRAYGVQQTGASLAFIWRLTILKCKKNIPPDARILVLGLGAGGSLKEMHELLPHCSITAVEHDREMITLTRKIKLFRPYPEPIIIEDDAKHALCTLEDTFDVIVVDLFDGSVASPLLLDRTFVTKLKARISKTGIVLINTYREPEKLQLASEMFAYGVVEQCTPDKTSNWVGAFSDTVVEASIV